MLTLTWDTHHRTLQADQLHAYDDGETGREEGQVTVIEWRYRADPGDAWSSPTVHMVTEPNTASYEPPAVGWVQIKAYSLRDGLMSWQGYVFEVYAIGGGIYSPGNRITDAGDDRITDAGDTRITE